MFRNKHFKDDGTFMAPCAVLSCCLMAVLFIIVLAPPVWATGNAPDPEEKADGEPRDWYLMLGGINSYPPLDRAAKQINRQVNLPLRLLAPGFDDVRTFEDQRDEAMIWTLSLTVGRIVSPRWDIFVQSGYSAGALETEQTNLSLLLLPLHTAMEIERSNFYAGAGTTFFPKGMVELRKYDTFKERLKGAKPYISSSLNWNHLTFDAEVKVGPVPFRNLLRIKQGDAWNIWSLGTNLGTDIPLSKRSALSMNVGYSYFFDNGEDFTGPSFAIFCKRYF